MGYVFTTTDTRSKGGPLSLDIERLTDITLLVGFPEHIEGEIQLEVRIEDMPPGETDLRGESGLNSDPQPGFFAFYVTVFVLDKPDFGEKALYQLNNALVHELRHIAQVLTGSVNRDFPSEIDAIQFGRLAHRPMFCAITGAKPFEAVTFCCDICGDVTATALPNGKTAYQHANASCTGVVEMQMALPDA